MFSTQKHWGGPAESKHSLDDQLLVDTLFNLSPDVFLHCQRTRELALSLGETLGLTAKELHLTGLGALLHDIGKSLLPEAILNKPTKLTPKEWELIQQHPLYGYQLLEETNLSEAVKKIVLNHHTWANGHGGYPSDLACSQPCFLTQVVTVADVAEAMTSNRAYRPALTIDACLEHLSENVGTMFSKDVVSVLRTIVSRKELLDAEY